MRLVLDQNLSFKLPSRLQSAFPGMCHVKDFGLDQADDSAVWSFAAKNGLTIVSKDDDFRQRSLVLGAPPKVIWLKIGNCSTEVAVQVLLSGKDRIISFRDEPEATILILSR